MGMFDSFYIEYQEKEHEVQTKQFENLLDIWRIGDVVNQPKAGVQVYFEERFWNTGTDVMDYSFEHDDTANCVIFIVIANGVFVYSNVVDSFHTNILNRNMVLNEIKSLQEEWSDVNKQNDFFVNHLNKKQQEIASYRKELNLILGYIREYATKDEEKSKFEGLTKHHYSRLEQIQSESDLLDVINDIADTALMSNTWDDVDIDTDQLVQYRI